MHRLKDTTDYQFTVTEVSDIVETVIVRDLYRKDLTVLSVRYHWGETSASYFHSLHVT